MTQPTTKSPPLKIPLPDQVPLPGAFDGIASAAYGPFRVRVRRHELGADLTTWHLFLDDHDGRLVRMQACFLERDIEDDLERMALEVLHSTILRSRGVGITQAEREEWGPDYDPGPHPDPARRQAAHALHVEMSRRGVDDHYGFASGVLGRRVRHLSRCSGPERNEIRAALTAPEVLA